MVRPTLLYGCETWPMSVRYEKRMATAEMRMAQGTMGGADSDGQEKVGIVRAR